MPLYKMTILFTATVLFLSGCSIHSAKEQPIYKKTAEIQSLVDRSQWSGKRIKSRKICLKSMFINYWRMNRNTAVYKMKFKLQFSMRKIKKGNECRPHSKLYRSHLL